MSLDEQLENQIAEWRGYMRRRRAVNETDVEELEDHLRSTVADLTDSGLRPDEAFLVAVKRMGSLDDLSREFARVHSDRLWKQLVLSGDGQAHSHRASRMDLLVMVGCAALAAIGIKLPELFGLGFDEGAGFYQRNISLFALVPLAAYFAIRRRLSAVFAGVVAALFVLGAVAANVYPLKDTSQSMVLTAIHLPLALWLAMGVAYVGGDWRSGRRRMDFIRFTGEWFVYYVLIALGGGVLTGITFGVFGAIGLDIEEFMASWVMPCGALAAVVVAAWLVEAKQSVIENMAPVLTRVFTPLFAVALLAFLGALLWTGNLINTDREVLILFDLLLVVVLGLVLYSISARDPLARPGAFDWLQLALVFSALIIDALVLGVITGRISEWGTTPNKAAALGENVILLANLAWTTFLLSEFVRNRRPFAPLERWQTGYLAVYAGWAWVVVLLFPPIFGYM
ncbi:permease prefix domain 1-containing protein [Allorhizocola rhizosphaerae]|uniref:permease prefix domain 1-containing protein n=1 Tax=Allorhizocola rhizosphaerae TaxID=1872709 RepID=UPI000E3C95AB|nr:permease prefix domain 1-containing protein [Allorhizocola rhizosphaerae]